MTQTSSSDNTAVCDNNINNDVIVSTIHWRRLLFSAIIMRNIYFSRQQLNSPVTLWLTETLMLTQELQPRDSVANRDTGAVARVTAPWLCGWQRHRCWRKSYSPVALWLTETPVLTQELQPRGSVANRDTGAVARVTAPWLCGWQRHRCCRKSYSPVVALWLTETPVLSQELQPRGSVADRDTGAVARVISKKLLHCTEQRSTFQAGCET